MLGSRPPQMLEPGDIIEQKYRIVRKIGEGGMGAVFEAEATRIHRRVAIKVMHISSDNADELARRFQLEAQAAGRIGSRHIVEVLDFGTVDASGHFMVMEYLEGESLRSRIARAAPLAPAAIHHIAEQLLDGVAAAHGAGIVHRDLKPDNVFLVRQSNGTDFVKLLDFGISKFSSVPGADGGMGLTRTGALLGTPYYLSPEQANGSKVVDHRADIYALGVILYECLTGEVPFHADTFNELLFKIVLEPAKPISRSISEAAPVFCALVGRAMAKDPKQRFSTVIEMKSALDAWTQNGAPASVVSRASEPELERTRAAPSGEGLSTIETWANSGDFALPDSEAPKSRRRLARVLPLVAAAVAVTGVAALAIGYLARTPTEAATPVASAPSPAASPNIVERPSLARGADVSAAPFVGPGVASASPSELARFDNSARTPSSGGRVPGNRTAKPQPATRASSVPPPAPPVAVGAPPAPPPARAAPASDANVVRTPGGRVFRGDL